MASPQAARYYAATPAIDTLRTARTLEAAGFTGAQAEAITGMLAEMVACRAPDREPARAAPSRDVDASFIFCLLASQIAVAVMIAAILHHARGG